MSKPEEGLSLRNVKIRVNTPEISKLVQEYLFKHGCYWTDPVLDSPSHLTSKYLYVAGNGKLGFGADGKQAEEYFNMYSHTELTFDVIKENTIVMVPTTVTKLHLHNMRRVKELVEFGGKKYIKEELEKVLSLLKSV